MQRTKKSKPDILKKKGDKKMKSEEGMRVKSEEGTNGDKKMKKIKNKDREGR